MAHKNGIENLKDLRVKNDGELKELFVKLKKEVSEHMSGILKGKDKNAKKAIALRRQMARVKTILNERVNK